MVEDIVSNRIVKVTKPGLFGAQGEDAGNYILRWALHNLAFNSDVTLEGIVTFPGEHSPRAVISQPFVFGRDATSDEQTDFLKERGFHEVESGRWVHPVRGFVVWDTITPGNAIMTDEGVVPIDYQIDHASTQELNRVRQQTGIGKNTSFSISNDPPLPSLNRRDP
ncbi:MAG: hypothetical protein EOP85_11735 [Verrucomicrobiaceae bacterium]|nr:MAG: hypothetical protein EOP85_11735 [Verrucomicrobiaceae bacterium]